MTFSCTFPAVYTTEAGSNSATWRTSLSATACGTRSGLGKGIWIWGGRTLAGIRHQTWGSYSGKKERNATRHGPSREALVRDLLESGEVWLAAVYVLVWCAASLTLLIAQAAFSHTVPTEESV